MTHFEKTFKSKHVFTKNAVKNEIRNTKWIASHNKFLKYLYTSKVYEKRPRSEFVALLGLRKL